MIFPKEFKEAISHLPSARKDELILRLLKNDLPLANRLHFELLSTTPVDERREKLEDRIRVRAARMNERFYSPGDLNMDVREMSGEINQHVSITKDKFGEASLNLLLLKEVLKHNNHNVLAATPRKAEKFCIAAIARTFKIMLLIKKLNQDYFMEFAADLKELGNLMAKNDYLMSTAIHHGLDANWLMQADIPYDIADIHKDLRTRGYLK